MNADTLLINRLMVFCEYFELKIVSKKNWGYYVALACTLNSLFWAFPSYQKIFTDDIKVNGDLSFWKRVNQQIEHPLTHFDYSPTTHEAKVSFRLLAPLLAKFSPFNSLSSRFAYLFFLQHIAGFFFFYFLSLFTFRYSQSRVVSSLFAFAISMTYLGHSFFYELYGFFDGIAFTLLLMSMYYYQKWYCILLFFFSFWIDERAVISSGFVLFFNISQDNDFSNVGQWKKIIYNSIPFLAAYALYLFIRKYLETSYGLTVPIGTEYDAGLGLILQQAKSLPLATLLSYEALWFIVALGTLAMCYARLYLVLGIYIFIFLFIVIVAYSVWDVTRSLVYGFPFVLICARYILPSFSIRRSKLIMLTVLFFNLIIPSYKNHYFQFYWQVPLPVKIIYYLKE